MNKFYQINYLSKNFFEKYKSEDYPEIENKENRPYIVILIQINKNTFAVPFRTNVPHNNCYKFRTSGRKTDTVTGIDYSKSVVVNNKIYIGQSATIDDKEYVELSRNYDFIIKQFKKYVDGYSEYVKGKKSFYTEKKYKYTTLKYFHNELGLTD